jgi:hypothetical protein
MCVDCVLASPTSAQVDPGDEPLPEVVLSHCSWYVKVQVFMGFRGPRVGGVVRYFLKSSKVSCAS